MNNSLIVNALFVALLASAQASPAQLRPLDAAAMLDGQRALERTRALVLGELRGNLEGKGPFGADAAGRLFGVDDVDGQRYRPDLAVISSRPDASARAGQR